jgi:signal transduction histidine kinase
MGDFEHSIRYFTRTLEQLDIRLPSGKAATAARLVMELGVQVLFSFGLKRVLPKRKGKNVYLSVRILNKLSYSLFFQDMILCLFAHFKALNIADRLEDSYEKAETYVFHIIATFQMFLKRISFNYLRKSINMANKIKRKYFLAFTQSFGGITYYYDAKWRNARINFENSIESYKSVGDFWGGITPIEHIGLIEEYTGNLGNSIKFFNKEKQLCEKCNDLRGYLNASGTLLLIKKLVGKDNSEEILSIERRKNEISDSLVQTGILKNQIKVFLIDNELIEAFNCLQIAFKTIKEKSLAQEYIASCYSDYCETLILEKRNRTHEKAAIEYSDDKLLGELFIYTRKAFFTALKYPAHMGAALRCFAWYNAFKGRRDFARYFFMKAIAKHHLLGMKYEEAKSLRDYGLFLDDCSLPGEAGDRYDAAYRLFRRCGATLEMKRLEDWVDPALVVEEPAVTEDKPSTSVLSDIDIMRMEMLYEVGASMSQIDDIETLLGQVLAAIITATGAQYGCIFLESTDHHPTRTLAMDFEGNVLNETEVTYAQEIVQKVRESGQSILISDGVSGKTGKIRSVFCVPLARGGNYMGCVYLGNNNVADLFSKGSEKAAGVLSAQASILLENAYLMDNYKRLNLQLQKRVREQTKDIRDKNSQLEKNHLKLVESERMKTILTGAIVHDIKNYAAGIKGNLKVMGKKYADHTGLHTNIGVAGESCADIMDLASNLLDIGKMEEGELKLKKQDIKGPQICSIIEKLRRNPIFEYKGIEFQIVAPEDGFVIHADHYLLERVLQNLASNAAKYTPENGIVIAGFSAESEGNIVSLFNSGVPIPDEYKSILFEKYSRLEQDRSQYSKGLGLFFCRLVMNAHGGRIWVDTGDSGNCFKLGFGEE